MCLPLPGSFARPGAWLAALGSACREAQPDGWGCKNTGLPGVMERLGLVHASFLPSLPFGGGFRNTLQALISSSLSPCPGSFPAG